MNETWMDKDFLKSLAEQIDTPALLVIEERLSKNIAEMQELADENNVRLRPHIKTHKSVEIAGRQLREGAKGISVAKVSEAEVMASAGINDIFIANEISSLPKLRRLRQLQEQITVSIGIDHWQQVELAAKVFENADRPLKVLIEIDSGLRRCGVVPGKPLFNLARKIEAVPFLELAGIFTHAGHVYSAVSEKQVQLIGESEAEIMAECADSLRSAGIKIGTVSVGSTPTVRYSAQHPVVTEVRPGNYVFYDNIQVQLGSCRMEQTALYVLATVISQPAADRIVTDAGSKALHLDRGAHGSETVQGFGHLPDLAGSVVRLSEEHGVVILDKPQPAEPGTPLLILPNHACAVVNLFDKMHLLQTDGAIIELPVDGRGKSQ